MSHIVGSRNMSIFRTNLFSSSGVHDAPEVVSRCSCLVVTISLESKSACSNDRGVVDMMGRLQERYAFEEGEERERPMSIV